MSRRKPQNIAIDPDKGLAYVPVGLYAAYGYATIDLKDLEKVEDYYWTKDGNNYAKTGTHHAYGKYTYMHRMICPTRPGLTVDHINRDVRDNRRSNLREATRREQSINRSTHTYKSRNRTSKYKGVSYVKNPNNRKNPWQFALYSVDIPGGKIYGYRNNEIEAALEYNKLATQYQGDRAVLNQVKVSK